MRLSAMLLRIPADRLPQIIEPDLTFGKRLIDKAVGQKRPRKRKRNPRHRTQCPQRHCNDIVFPVVPGKGKHGFHILWAVGLGRDLHNLRALGLSVLKNLKTSTETQGIPVIILTGSRSTGSSQQEDAPLQSDRTRSD